MGIRGEGFESAYTMKRTAPPSGAVKPFLLALCGALVWAVLPTDAVAGEAAPRPPPNVRKVVFGRYPSILNEFEEFARRAKQSGATHMVLTAEDLPWATCARRPAIVTCP
jgi:hypothetical protein